MPPAKPLSSESGPETGTETGTVTTDAPARSRRTLLLLVALVTALSVGAAAFSIGRLSTLDDPDPSNTSAEAGFARDMQVHHRQGVELAMIIRDGTDDDPVRLLAYDIAATQGHQAGQLYGWLTVWGLGQAGSEPSMTWMTRDGRAGSAPEHASGTHEPGRPMPGLATGEQIAGLSSLTGIAAEREFLTLMIAHHHGAVEMAEALLDRSDNATVRAFANGVVLSQESEITLMTEMLATRS